MRRPKSRGPTWPSNDLQVRCGPGFLHFICQSVWAVEKRYGAKCSSMPTRKKPPIALVLSLIVPGLGQIYNIQVIKGLVIAGACLALGLGSFWLSGLSSLSAALALLLMWVSAILDAYKTAKTSGQPLDWYYRVPYVVAMLLLIGPLALPLLWRSPYFSRFARWGWTTVVIGAVLLFLATPYLLNWLIQQMSDLAALFDKSKWGPYPQFSLKW